MSAYDEILELKKRISQSIIGQTLVVERLLCLFAAMLLFQLQPKHLVERTRFYLSQEVDLAWHNE